MFIKARDLGVIGHRWVQAQGLIHRSFEIIHASKKLLEGGADDDKDGDGDDDAEEDDENDKRMVMKMVTTMVGSESPITSSISARTFSCTFGCLAWSGEMPVMIVIQLLSLYFSLFVLQEKRQQQGESVHHKVKEDGHGPPGCVSACE